MLKFSSTPFSIALIGFCACSFTTSNKQSTEKPAVVNEKASILQNRFMPPLGYKRRPYDVGSFAHYLRQLPLKPDGARVQLYNGNYKQADVYSAVVAMDIGSKDLQQCADAVMRLRAEYFYAKKQYDQINFWLNNGFYAKYSEWIKGKRIRVQGKQTAWVQNAVASNTYKDFRNFMDFIFTYSSTLSLDQHLTAKSIKQIEVGDVFVKGGSPGHAVIVVDLAENEMGEKVIMLAQSYMPAQDIQILKEEHSGLPWFPLPKAEMMHTPEWDFTVDQLKEF